MAPTLPGWKVFENTLALTTAASPLVSPWFETTGYTNLVLAYTFTTGTTVMTIEGSYDGSTQDSTIAYASLAASPQTALVVAVMHTYIRFRIVQTISNATVTTVFAQSRA
jgi:hypothetical protein